MTTTPDMTYAQVAAITARLGFRPVDVAEEIGMDQRRFRRIRTGKLPVPAWLADQITQWAEEVDTDAQMLATRLKEQYHATGQPVTLVRYPSKGFLARTQQGIKARSVESWDAFLALTMFTLEADSVPYTLTTRGASQ